MATIQPIANRDAQALARLITIWEASVRETHTFLTEADIAALKPEVHSALLGVPALHGAYQEGVLQGFVGTAGDMIEMLFVDAALRGAGIGKQLLAYATGALGAKRVDVNEQNAQGVGFYQHMGFAVAGRSETDGQGRPFPLLHLRLATDAKGGA